VLLPVTKYRNTTGDKRQTQISKQPIAEEYNQTAKYSTTTTTLAKLEQNDYTSTFCAWKWLRPMQSHLRQAIQLQAARLTVRKKCTRQKNFSEPAVHLIQQPRPFFSLTRAQSGAAGRTCPQHVRPAKNLR